MTDVVARYIELKEQKKNVEEQLSALELIIFESHRDDPRIKVVSSRKTITLRKETYELLDKIGIETTVSETRLKVIDEFDINTQKMLLSNEDNFDVKFSKESIRVK
jgi:hypothetical protein